ncbi:hypothetical protein G4P69_05300 [Aetokthonos hydrillicola CCALA 1050]|nr:hypothetical protein [Aetokthonos hydrillicola CCALA 1050]
MPCQRQMLQRVLSLSLNSFGLAKTNKRLTLDIVLAIIKFLANQLIAA